MEYNLKLSKDQIGMIGAALAEMPYKAVCFLMADIQRQVDEAERAVSENPETKE